MWRWIKWEFGRRIEVTGIIKLIIVERFVKGGLIIIGGIILFFLSANHVLVNLAQNIQDQLNFDPSTHPQGLWHRTINWFVLKFGTLGETKEELIAVAGALYGGLEVLEGVGLMLRRRWAEYLVFLAVIAFLPPEIDELFHKISVIKVGALLVNIAIAVYFVWKKKLFLERPGAETVADRAAPPPTAGEAT